LHGAGWGVDGGGGEGDGDGGGVHDAPPTAEASFTLPVMRSASKRHAGTDAESVNGPPASNVPEAVLNGVGDVDDAR